MAKSIFDHAKSLCTDKTPWSSLSEEDQKSWNTFMENKILSMNPDNLEVVDLIQMHSNMPPHAVHAFYCSILPKGYRFIPLLKKGGNLEQIKAIAAYYNISRREAREYLRWLPSKLIEWIEHNYNQEPYEATKIKKKK